MAEEYRGDGKALVQSDLNRCARIFQEFDPVFWGNQPADMQFDVGPIKLPKIPLHPDIYPPSHYRVDDDALDPSSSINAVVDFTTGKVTFSESILTLPDKFRQRVVTTQAAVNTLSENKIRPPTENELDQCYDYFENKLGGMHTWLPHQLEIHQYGLVKTILADHMVVGSLDRDGMDMFWTKTIPRMFAVAVEYLEQCESMYGFNKMLEVGTWDIAENDPWRFFIYETLESFRDIHQSGKNWQELFAIFKTGDSHNFRDELTDLMGDQFKAKEFTGRIYEALTADPLSQQTAEIENMLFRDFITYDERMRIIGTEFSAN